jgi:molybdate transport system substrate-binding protein
MVLSSLALKGVLEKLQAAVSGIEIRFDATQAILAALQAGAKADLLILTTEALEDLRKHGRVSDLYPLGSSGVGVAVRAGARQPEIGSVDAFTHALVNARSVAHSKVGASGIYFSQLLKDLKIEEKLKKRIVVEKGPVALAVARGEAELGIQQLCELAPVAGIDIVGALPEPLQRLTHFAAAVPADAADRRAALQVVDLLRSAAGRKAMLDGLINPA